MEFVDRVPAEDKKFVPFDVRAQMSGAGVH